MQGTQRAAVPLASSSLTTQLGATALSWAALRGHVTAARTLIAAGANINATSRVGVVYDRVRSLPATNYRT